MEVLLLGDLMVPEGLVALHLVVPVALEVYHLLEALEGLVVRLLAVLAVLVVLVVPVALVFLPLEALVVLVVLIPKINPPWADLPVVLPHINLFTSLPMALLVIICHINITNMWNPIEDRKSVV